LSGKKIKVDKQHTQRPWGCLTITKQSQYCYPVAGVLNTRRKEEEGWMDDVSGAVVVSCGKRKKQRP
jgi:hypothetical protein